jgi:integrase
VVKTRTYEGLLAKVIDLFISSPKWAELAPATKDCWKRELLLVQEAIGHLAVEQIRPSITQLYLDQLAYSPSKQRNARTALKALEKWGMLRDFIPFAFCPGLEVTGELGGHEPWTDEQVALAERHAREWLSRAVTLGANTGQRGSDLVRLGWGDLEFHQGHWGLKLTQQKTKKALWVPHTPELERAIDTWPKRLGPFILMPDDEVPGKLRPATRPDLSRHWLRERDGNPELAPLRGLAMHGLRATAVVRLRRANVAAPLIADYVGMSEEMVKHYCRLSNQRDNALAAVESLERVRDDKERKGKR